MLIVERDELDRCLDEVLVGGREPAQVRIVEYDPEWPERFLLERDRIAAALGDGVGAIEHIGSTATSCFGTGCAAIRPTGPPTRPSSASWPLRSGPT
jgi:hypothetical protein